MILLGLRAANVILVVYGRAWASFNDVKEESFSQIDRFIPSEFSLSDDVKKKLMLAHKSDR